MEEQERSLDEILKELQKEHRQGAKVSVQKLTEIKISQAEERIKQIDKKIEKLIEEKNNLLRRNENRRKSLQDRAE